MLKQAQAMQEQFMQARATAAEAQVEGQAGGGVVKVRVTGSMEFLGVTIDPTVVDPDDVPMLEDLVLAAVRDAVARATELSEKAMGSVDLGPLGGGLLG
ncbi:MAG TPA: YbaB/EbfC family nucleoid-associated protein [Acidimicrobiales bacterium]|nr:YbaB/EbfC family nucleoid-associated protein [Acidimicrobiales bacterium]